MTDLILSTADLYGIFLITLVLVNSLAKLTFDNDFVSKTRKIVALFSCLVVFAFWLIGAELQRLILYAFAVFGFYDFVGRYIEQGVAWLFYQLGNWWNSFIEWLKVLFRLYNK